MIARRRRPALLVLLTALTCGALAASGAVAPVAAAPPPAGERAAVPAASVGELPDRRTATSSTRRNADGSLTTTLFAAPVHYRSGDRWLPIDSRLVAAGANGSAGRDGYSWRNAANSFDARFAARPGANFLQLTTGAGRFRLSADGAGGQPGSAQGSSVTYRQAYRAADLHYAAVSTGVKELITLAGPDAPTSYSFRLSGPPTGPALSATRRADGSYEVSLPPHAGPVLVLDAPTVTEAAPRGEVYPPDPDARPRLDVRADGRDLLVRLDIEGSWLRASGRRFPVEIDPTFSVQPDSEDAFFGMPNYGALTGERIFIGTTDTAWRGAIQFDLAGLPTNAPVSDAKLGLYYDGVCIALPAGAPFCGGVSHQLDAHRMTAPWSTGSSADQLAFDATPAGSYTLPAAAQFGWMTWPVTSTVQGWLSGTIPNYGVLLKRRTEDPNLSGPVPPGRRFTGSPNYLPKLEVTVVNDAVDLLAPTTVHGNGADLAWSRYAGSAPFDRYEVHRSSSATFTPTASTLLTTITDPNVTTYRDTTASGGKTFTYRVVANTDASVPRTVTLPADGQARTLIQPDPAAGQHTFLYKSTTSTNCANYGADPKAWVGTNTASIYRNVLRFDLRTIPPKSQITQATASLWKIGGPGLPVTVEAHRITQAWKEGTGLSTCGADGATWYETQNGQDWSSQGGDYDSTVAASLAVPANAPAGFEQFGLTSLVQSWVNGAAPNLGVLLRASDETVRANAYLYYATDDETTSPFNRPKLEVSYQDGSVTQKPRVALATPAAGQKVSGTAVRVAASAGDDRRVESVDFAVDGNPIGRDTSAPFEVTWNSTLVPNGQPTITVTATDDAGNTTTTAGTKVVVDNTAPPSGALMAPAANETVGNPATLSADASDDVGVTQVEFLVDGVRVGAPVTAAPYTLAWNTLDPLARIFDGPHQLTAVVTDTSGQQFTTPARQITVGNAGISRYRASVELNAAGPDDDVPLAVGEDPSAPEQDPYANVPPRADGTQPGSLDRSFTDPPRNDAGTPPQTCPLDAYCPTVTVTNTSGSTWTGTGPEVWYTWYAPNGALLYQGVAARTVDADLRSGRSSAPVPLVIRSPNLPPGAERGEFRLRVDLYDRAAGTWFAARSNPPEDNPVIVTRELAGNLGLERFWPYEGEAAGAGMSTLSNVSNGNLLLRWSPFFAPGRGLATMLDLTYNSLEDHSTSPAGNNVSLSISGLARLGEPIDIHPNNADTISGHARKFVDITDGDGTVHRFEGTTGTDGVTRWQEPPGVNLYLRALTNDPRGAWALTRPDKVTFYFDQAGFPLSVEDRNGNRLTFTLEDTPPGDDPGGPKKRVSRVTDAGGRSFVLDYWTKDEAKKAHVRGNIQRITDHSGSALDFEYYEDGNLRRLIQRGGSQADGDFLADRTFVFTYTTSNGAGPAIPNAADRVDPAPRTPNQSTRLFSVRDPRGRETQFAYYLPTDGPHLRWKLKQRTNRAGKTTAFSYDLTNRITTVTAPLARTTSYTYDTDGKATHIVNPLGEPTDVEWTPDFEVKKVTEPTTKFSLYDYNANGYLTSQTNTAGETTKLTYLDQAVDGNDTAKHLSVLATVTKPRGVATTSDDTDFRWVFGPDAAGNIHTVTDPTGATTTYDYNQAGSAAPGTVAAIHDANGNAATTFPSYDPSGQPTEMRDPLGKSTRFGYDVDGLLRFLQDPNHAADTGTDVRAYRDYFDYDSFGRLGRQSAPKSTATDRGKLIWSGTEFDANDNVVRKIDPHYGSTADDAENAPFSTATYDEMDRPDVVSNSDRHADQAGERTNTDYDDAGRRIRVTRPKGVTTTALDFAVEYGYDKLDRVLKQTVYGADSTQKRITHYCYDLAGDLRSVTAPRALRDSITCPATGVPNTTTLDYDDAHRQTGQTDPLGHATRVGYDENGNRTVVERDIATGRVNRRTTAYDQRDLPVETRERLTGTREVRSLTRYDRNGNRTELISPRAYDTAAGSGTYTNYVTGFDYDALNRLVRTRLPFDGSDGTERQYVHQSYDDNGNVTSTSLPVTTAMASSVGAGAKTRLSYFDPGWIRTSDEAPTPAVRFDYTAQGWQASRVPDKAGSPGVPDDHARMSWSYFDDGQVRTRTDNGGQSSSYDYDAHNLLKTGTDAAGITSPGEEAVGTEATYNGFDEVAKTRFHKGASSTWTFSDYSYDEDGNVKVRRENGTESATGVQSQAPRRYEMTYDAADWLTQQLDLGVDSACKGDQRVVTAFWPTGWEKQRDIYRAGATCAADPTTWPKKQTTTWDHFDNGKLKTLVTKNGAGTVTESHTVGYEIGGIYVDGNRVSDRYVLTRAAGRTATTCVATAPCDAAYDYDARDRLIRHQLRVGKEIRYTLDQPANLLGDTTVRAGNVTTENRFGTTTTRKYTANQLTSATVGTVTTKYWYDSQGNLDCVTLAAGTQANCSPTDTSSASTNLVTDYTYDYLSRVTSQRSYAGGTRTDKADYVYDALDRTVREVEDHTGTGKDRTTAFTYQGLTTLVTREAQTGGTNPRTKTYAYDAYDHRLSMTDTQTGSTADPVPYSYSHDVHGSVSQLINDAGAVRASYGYDAYGGQDAPDSDPQALTTGEPDNQTPLNPYRYAGHRMDSGTATSPSAPAALDMGVRRFGPDTTRFLQTDLYRMALANLDLGTDPLTQNRYALAGGNPISFVEIDGHGPVYDGSGGASSSSQPPPPTTGWGASFRQAESASDDGAKARPSYPEAVVPREIQQTSPKFRQRWVKDLLTTIRESPQTEEENKQYEQAKAAYCAEFADTWCRPATTKEKIDGALLVASIVPVGRAAATAGKGIAWLARLGRGGKAAQTAARIGFAPGEADAALTAGRLQHGTRHLTDAGVLPAWSGKNSPEIIRNTLSPILENPTATFDTTLGATRVKGFLGEVNNQPVAVFVYKEGAYQGELATSYVPSPDQLTKWGL